MDALLARLPSRLFGEWMAYDRLDPIGNARGDMQAALVAWVMANAHRNPKRQRKPYRLEDFLLRFEPKRARSPKELLHMVEMLNAAFEGRDLRRKK